MTRNLKALGLALVAVLAMGAVAVQGASAAVEHEFHSDGPKTTVTGTNSIIGTNAKGETETQLSPHTFAVGEAGVVTCNNVTIEGTQTGTKVNETTYKTDSVTVTPHYKECSAFGNPATVDFEHCAYTFDSDTTTGNTTGGEHANVELECAAGNSVKITTSVCTLIIEPQLIKHAVSYENDKHNLNAINVIATAHEVNVTHNGLRGCLLVPKGKVGKYTGTTTNTCYKDENLTALEGTDKTTPTEKTTHGPETRCTVSPGA